MDAVQFTHSITVVTCFIAFFAIYKQRFFFLVVTIALGVSATYFALVNNVVLPWWGLNGDEIFIFAFFEKVLSGQPFSDFFYHDLSVFYPPLYFWLVGGIASLFKLTAIQAGKLGVLLVLLFTPIITYIWTQKSRLNWTRQRSALVALSVFIVADWSAVMFKPYEYMSAVVALLWFCALAVKIKNNNLTSKDVWIYGAMGALLFLTFYFWFFALMLASLIFILLYQVNIIPQYRKIAAIISVMVFGSLPFTVPLLVDITRHGSENFQAAFLVLSDFDVYAPFVSLSIYGLVTLVGVISLFKLRKKTFIKALTSVILASYLWQLISLITYITLGKTFGPAKNFLFLTGAALVFAAAYGIAEFFKNKELVKMHHISVLMLITLFGYQLLGGQFTAKSENQLQYQSALQPRTDIEQLAMRLEQLPDKDQLRFLSAGIGPVHAYTTLNQFISSNAHYSHPAAQFSLRLEIVKKLATSNSADQLHQRLSTPLGDIDALLLHQIDNRYYLFFWVDNFPNGGRELVIEFPAQLLDEQYFDQRFSESGIVLFMPKKQLEAN